MPEGGSATVNARLGGNPGGPVTATVAISGDGDLTASPSTLSFGTNNWSQWQTITVSAREDGDTNNGTASLTVRAGTVAAGSTATEADNDTLLSLAASPAEGGTATTTAGGTAATSAVVTKGSPAPISAVAAAG